MKSLASLGRSAFCAALAALSCLAASAQDAERPAELIDQIQREEAVALCKTEIALVMRDAFEPPFALAFDSERVVDVRAARPSSFEGAPAARFAVELAARIEFADGSAPKSRTARCGFEAFSGSRVELYAIGGY